MNVENWKEFRVGDLFETENGKRVPTGAYVKKDVLFNNPGNIPRITVKGVNNGIDGHYSENIDNSNYRICNNFISVSFLGDCFYQKYKASLDMKVHCLKPLNINLNDFIAIFIITVLKKEMSVYSYGDQLNSETLKDMSLKLPAKDDDTPDFDYMEEFIKTREDIVKEKVRIFNNIISEPSKLDIEGGGYLE